MARPRKGEEKNAAIHLGFRMPEWVSERLVKLAEKDGKPKSDLANEALVAYLKKRGIVAPKKAAR
jgi:predicted DNA-binding protein